MRHTSNPSRIYFEQYPKGKYLSDALRRIGQIEGEQKSALAGRQAEAELRPGKVFKDCADCPEMVVIPGGNSQMGSNSGDNDEKPAHSVRIGKAYALAKTEVTQGQWRAVMGSNPPLFTKETCPANTACPAGS